MADELPRLGPGGREAEAVDDVVQPPLEGDQQLLAGAPAAPVGRGDVAAKLLLADAVVALGQLLGAQLGAEDRRLVRRAAGRAGRAAAARGARAPTCR